jgi:DNA-binding response OmpR family regulator
MKETKYKVLIVDDEPVIIQLITSLLSAKGHACATEKNGMDALNRYNKESFDAVITDIMMPEMDGLTLTRKITAQDGVVPVMVITGFTEEHTAEDALDAGASDFIEKPFSIEEFYVRFQRMMRDRTLLSEIKGRKNEIEKISSEMIAGVEKDSLERIGALRKEIEELRKNNG